MAKILLVDDEAYVTTAVATKLAKLGHQTLVACDGLEGYEAARSFAPNLIVSDLQMPTLDGLGMAKRLAQSEQTSAIPVILLTGRGHLVPPEQLAQTQVRQLLAKPFSVRDLVAQIEQELKAAA